MTLKMMAKDVEMKSYPSGEVYEVRHVTVPVLWCDHCGKEITSATWGLNTWFVDAQNNPVGGTVYHLHKVACHKEFIEISVMTRPEGYRWIDQELVSMFGQLLEQCHLKLWQVERANPNISVGVMSYEQYRQECDALNERHAAAWYQSKQEEKKS